LHLREKNPATLSGGQIQRLAIAAALAKDPKILVLDEPTASLDVSGTQMVINILETLKKQYGISIILIEHRLAEVRRLADRVVIMEEGRIAVQGPFDAVLGNQATLRRYGLRRSTAEIRTDWSGLLMPNQPQPGDQKPFLDVKNLSAGYDGQAIVHDINLQVFQGEFVALVGDNGTGKSTLALAAAGLLKPLRGSVSINGSARPRPGLDIALLFQNPADQLFTDSVDEEVAFGPRNYRRYDAETHAVTLASADLSHLRARRPFTLSIGQQQRTALASCIALLPQLVILDEPTLGQDWFHLQQLMDRLVYLNQQGTAILLITHDYKLVYHYAERVLLMEKGRIVLDGKIARVSSKRNQAAAFAPAVF
jgi:energy-coupling factor transport system ATP-binding protein